MTALQISERADTRRSQSHVRSCHVGCELNKVKTHRRMLRHQAWRSPPQDVVKKDQLPTGKEVRFAAFPRPFTTFTLPFLDFPPPFP